MYPFSLLHKWDFFFFLYLDIKKKKKKLEEN